MPNVPGYGNIPDQQTDKRVYVPGVGYVDNSQSDFNRPSELAGAGGSQTTAGPKAVHASAPGQTAEDYANQQRRERLNTFITHMLGPIDYNDPDVKQLMLGAGNAAGTAASNRGIGGPLSVNGIQQGVTTQLNATQMQRQQAGLAAQDLLQRGDAQAAELAMRRDQIAYDRWAAEQQQKFAAGAGVGQSIGSVVGGVAGGIGGFVLSGGNPMGAAAGAQGGAQLLGGIGAQAGAGLSGGSYHFDPKTNGYGTAAYNKSSGLGGF